MFELLTRSRLHPVARLADFESELLALEANSSQRVGSIVMAHYDGCAVLRWQGQFNDLRRYFGQNGLALHDADFHVGAAAIPLEFIFAGLKLGSVDARGTQQIHRGLRGCERTRCHQQSQPHYQTLGNCREFHSCSFFLSRNSVGKRLGRPRFTTSAKKHFVFPHESPTMLRPGLCRQVTSLLCCVGGFLTWAAKPSARESPDPAKCRNQNLTSLHLFCRSVSYRCRLRVRPCRSSIWSRCHRTSLDGGHLLRIARNPANSLSAKEHWACVLCRGGVTIQRNRCIVAE